MGLKDAAKTGPFGAKMKFMVCSPGQRVGVWAVRTSFGKGGHFLRFVRMSFTNDPLHFYLLNIVVFHISFKRLNIVF